jgi:hypothetical protein
MSKIISLCLLLLSPLAWAIPGIQDPNGVLPKLRQFSGATAFADAFQCGDKSTMKVFVISCNQWTADEGGIFSSCTTPADDKGLVVTREVYNCTPDSVSFLNSVTGDSTDLTKADYEAANSNVGEAFLMQATDFSGYVQAQLTLDSIEDAQYTLRRGTAQEAKVPSVNVYGHMNEPGKFQVEVIMSVIRDAPGVAQVVRFRMNKETWFLGDDFVKANP